MPIRIYRDDQANVVVFTPSGVGPLPVDSLLALLGGANVIDVWHIYDPTKRELAGIPYTDILDEAGNPAGGNAAAVVVYLNGQFRHGPTSGFQSAAVLSLVVNNTLLPPTEVLGDRYLLSDTGGVPNPAWGGAVAGDLVEFNGTIWVSTHPEPGAVVLTTDTGYAHVLDAANQWVSFGQALPEIGDLSTLHTTDRSSLVAALNEVADTTSKDWQDSVLSLVVNNTLAPPTEVLGDRYLLSDTGGVPNPAWDGALAGDIVEFNGTIWVSTHPTTSMAVVADDTGYPYVYNAAGHWVDFGGTVLHNTLGGLDGGTPGVPGKFIHLTQAEYNKLTGIRDGATSAALHWGNGSVAATATTRFLSPGWEGGLAPSSVVQWAVPFAGTLKNLRLVHNGPAGNGNLIVYTVRVNGAPSALTVSLASTGATAADTTHTVVVAAGDLLDIQVTKALATGATPADVMASVELSA
ncbi:MAG: hypothetical protein A2Y38_12250 [Spirochaetes bacterium GWB1_59_5]|nr:MAG: hypothetical protein A2Y38_12250 [Spirochaetes bacterium GWB1_59_5]